MQASQGRNCRSILGVHSNDAPKSEQNQRSTVWKGNNGFVLASLQVNGFVQASMQANTCMSATGQDCRSASQAAVCAQDYTTSKQDHMSAWKGDSKFLGASLQ